MAAMPYRVRVSMWAPTMIAQSWMYLCGDGFEQSARGYNCSVGCQQDDNGDIERQANLPLRAGNRENKDRCEIKQQGNGIEYRYAAAACVPSDDQILHAGVYAFPLSVGEVIPYF